MRILKEGDLYQEVGERIRMIRRSITPLVRQEDVAARSDGQLSRSGIANIEAGRQSLTIHQLYRIAEILNVEPSILIPARSLVFQGSGEHLEDPAKMEWLGRVLSDEATQKKRKR